MAKDPGGLLGYSPCFYFCCFSRPELSSEDSTPEPENGVIIKEPCDNYGSIADQDSIEASWSGIAEKYSIEGDDVSRKQDSTTEVEEVLRDLDTNLASETIISNDSGPVEELRIESEPEAEEISGPCFGMTAALQSVSLSSVISSGSCSAPADGETSADETSEAQPPVLLISRSTEPAEEEPSEEEKGEEGEKQEEEKEEEKDPQTLPQEPPPPPSVPEGANEVTSTTGGDEIVPSPPADVTSIADDMTEISYRMASEDSGIVVEQTPGITITNSPAVVKKKKNKLFSKSAVFSDGDEPGSNLTASSYSLNAQSTTSLNTATKKKKFFKFKKLKFKKKKNKGGLESDVISKSTPSVAPSDISDHMSEQSRYSASVMLASLDALSDEDIAKE